MSLDDLKKADSDRKALGRTLREGPFVESQDYPLSIEVFNTRGEIVRKGTLSIWVREKPKGRSPWRV